MATSLLTGRKENMKEEEQAMERDRSHDAHQVRWANMTSEGEKAMEQDRNCDAHQVS